MTTKQHKIIFSLCLCLLISVITFPCFSQEQLTITTYYPAPYGVYMRMRLAPDAIVVGTACTADQEGAMAYSGIEESLLVCTTNGLGTGNAVTWELAPGFQTKYWVADRNIGSPIVGIRTDPNEVDTVGIGVGSSRFWMLNLGAAGATPRAIYVDHGYARFGYSHAAGRRVHMAINKGINTIMI